MCRRHSIIQTKVNSRNLLIKRSWNSSVTTVTKIFPFSKSSKATLGPTQPGAVSTRVKRPKLKLAFAYCRG